MVRRATAGVFTMIVTAVVALLKVDVEFKAVGRQPDTMMESDQDVIIQISRPYLQFTIAD